MVYRIASSDACTQFGALFTSHLLALQLKEPLIVVDLQPDVFCVDWIRLRPGTSSVLPFFNVVASSAKHSSHVRPVLNATNCQFGCFAFNAFNAA